MSDDVNDRIEVLSGQLNALAEEICAFQQIIAEQRELGIDVTPMVGTVTSMSRILRDGQRERLALYARRNQQPRLLDAPVVLKAEDKPEPVSIIVAWRSYAGFRADMIRREQVWRDQHTDMLALAVTIGMLAGHVRGDSEKSIKRQMARYHLDPARDWPPSTWPEIEPPMFDSTTAHRLSMVAAGFAWAVLDMVADRRLDGVVHMLRLVCSPWLG